ncbi:hypothetical protein N0V85_002081 [Neurospora sp. IMI 360204]|nr:hypothetical protein N0V85_002081 [Neurospora sp. IMI 360204]
MVNYRFIAFAGLAAALPLNINLGAYSPALVVARTGDGEISFGGKQDVSTLMNALEGAAVNAAAGAATKSAVAPAPAADEKKTVQAAAVPPPPPAAAAAPTVAPSSSVIIPTTPGGAGSPAAVDNSNAPKIDPTLAQQAQSISGLQGMGKKSIAPRTEEPCDDIDMDMDDTEETETASLDKAKRDLSGFDRALKFSEAALTKGPKVQLGTGAEGSGVGIIVDNNASTARPAAAAGKKKKRDADETTSTAPRRRTKVTTMYVRRGIPASLQNNPELAAREVVHSHIANVPIKFAKRDVTAAAAATATEVKRDTIDAVNLNVDTSNEGVTMTFVETVDDEEVEDEE